MSVVPEHAHINTVIRNFQNTNAPDIDLDRDIVQAGGILVNSESKNPKKYKFNLATIIMSTVVFLAILAWFDFIQTAFYTWLAPDTQVSGPAPTIKLYYAILITVFVACICGLLIIYSNPLAI